MVEPQQVQKVGADGKPMVGQDGKGHGPFGLAKHLKDTIKFQGGFSIAVGHFNNDKAPDIAIPIEPKGKVAILVNTQ